MSTKPIYGVVFDNAENRWDEFSLEVQGVTNHKIKNTRTAKTVNICNADWMMAVKLNKVFLLAAADVSTLEYTCEGLAKNILKLLDKNSFLKEANKSLSTTLQEHANVISDLKRDRTSLQKKVTKQNCEIVRLNTIITTVKEWFKKRAGNLFVLKQDPDMIERGKPENYQVCLTHILAEHYLCHEMPHVPFWHERYVTNIVDMLDNPVAIPAELYD